MKLSDAMVDRWNVMAHSGQQLPYPKEWIDHAEALEALAEASERRKNADTWEDYKQAVDDADAALDHLQELSDDNS